jgi:aminoglycoside phosphotransferase (APT) family kinase protein
MAELAENLATETRDYFGDNARIEELVPLAGGASRELYGFDVIDGAERHELVLRRDPPGLEDRESRARELAALEAAYGGGVPVPAPRWMTADGTGIVMQRVGGEAIARRLLRDDRYATARERLVDEVARAAAAVHAIAPPAELPAIDGPPALSAIEFCEAELDRLGEPHPALEIGLRWLREHLPPETEPTLVHGDLRLGNLMVDEGGLVALLDWEICHAGDGAEDLGWMCIRSWRFGADERPALGVGTREALLDAYAAAGGRRITLDELRFWEVLGNVRWGMICVRQAERETLEHYAIGRRACEPEWDLLSLLRAA